MAHNLILVHFYRIKALTSHTIRLKWAFYRIDKLLVLKMIKEFTIRKISFPVTASLLFNLELFTILSRRKLINELLIVLF